jgi:hypothetical protein
VVSFTLLPLYSQGKHPGTHWIGSLVGPRAGLDDMEERKSLHYSDSNPIEVQIRET